VAGVKTSESQTAIVGALLKAQANFPPIAKQKQGQAGHRSFMYAPFDVVLDAVRPVLLQNGLLLTQAVEGHELVTRLDHASGEWRESRMPVNTEHANMQSYGIELTYRRRYAAQPMLGIVTEDDTDGEGGQKRAGKNHQDTGAPAGQNGADVNKMAFDGLPPEVQDDLRKRAPKIDADALTDSQGAKAAVNEAVENWKRTCDPSEVKKGLWWLLDTKTKTAIRKVA
jgi:hypothetical protein